MADDSDDKTEDPTGHKLSKAREEGQIPVSQELKIWVGLFGVVAIIGMMAPGIARDVRVLVLPLIDHPHALPVDDSSVAQLLATLGLGTFGALAMPLGLILAFALAANFAQTGLLWVPKKLMPDFSKVNPWAGLKRMFSMRQLVDLAKNLVKMTVISAVLYTMIGGDMDAIATTATLELGAMMDFVQDKVFSLALVTLILITAVAAADVFYQRWEFTQKMKMTKQEVRDEHKNTEGDPMVKSRLRSLRMQRARQRMMAAVPGADVVVTNPTHYAVALKYDMDSMNAPVLVAKGADLVAKRIRDLATESEVPIVENPPLARALYATVELDQEVPPEHYKAVAEVIGYVMRLKGKLAH